MASVVSRTLRGTTSALRKDFPAETLMNRNHKELGTLTDISALIDSRLRGGTDTTAAQPEPEITCAPTAVGELRMIETDSIKVGGERFRRRVEVGDLATSIRLYGQLVPIMVRTDLTLVNGQRRLEACKQLGVPVFAHIVDVLDAEAAQIEEDRCRHQLTPYEMYRVTEALRPRLEDEAWARKVLGKKQYDRAAKKGRVDEILAEHVGISRGTLRKIRDIVGAWHAAPEKFQNLLEALETDGRVDRHYRAFKVMSEPVYEGPKLTAVAFAPDWQVAMEEDLSKVVASVDRINFKQVVADGAILMLPSRLDMLAAAMVLINRTGAKLETSLGAKNEGEEVILFARFGKTPESRDMLSAIKEQINSGLGGVAAFEKVANRDSRYLLSFADRFHQAP